MYLLKGTLVMNTNVIINNHDLAVKEYENQRVITLKEIDKVHERLEGTASRNFIANKKHFIDGEDYFIVKPSNIPNNEFRCLNIRSPRGLTLITESGYLMLVKSFTDELAWEVQRQLVNTYFRVKETLPISQSNQIAALRLIVDQIEKNQADITALKEADKVVINRLEEIENHPQIGESTSKRIDELEEKYAGVSSIHLKPLKAKKYNVLDELYKCFTSLDGKHCLLSGNAESDKRMEALIAECITEMKGMYISAIYKTGKEISALEKAREALFPWKNIDFKSIPGNYKAWQYIP